MRDLTAILTAALTILFGLADLFLIPWLKANLDEKKREKLSKAINIGVYAAQQLFPPEAASAKLSYVQDYLRKRGYDADADIIRTEIEAAVKALKIALAQ